MTHFVDKKDKSDNDVLATSNLCYFCNPWNPALSMLYLCFIHALSTPYPRFFHALSTLYPCLSTLYPCFIHALFMLYPCFIQAYHALFMLYPCFIHALLIHCLITGARWPGEKRKFFTRSKMTQKGYFVLRRADNEISISFYEHIKIHLR